jgi:hypothetical protein
MTFRGWGAPFVTGIAPGRLEASGERHGDSRCGEDGAGWRTAERRGGGAPARPSRQCGAQGRKQMTRSSSSPPCEPPEGDHDGWATASERSNGGGGLGFR